MATAAGQAKAQALNAKLESEARIVIDDIDKSYMRKVARDSLTCSIKCYDKAGKTGSSDALEMCVNNCQVAHRQANAMVQQEIGQFQNRLGRAMHECEDKARDQMRPGFEQDAKLMAKVEDTLIGCVSDTVHEYIGKLKPLKERVISQLK